MVLHVKSRKHRQHHKSKAVRRCRALARLTAIDPKGFELFQKPRTGLPKEGSDAKRGLASLGNLHHVLRAVKAN